MEFGIGERGKVGTSNDSIKKMQLRKYETLKKMILILHDSDDREWGRYCPYGCHCMVNGPTDLLSGHGQAVDEIDSACKRHQDHSCKMAYIGPKKITAFGHFLKTYLLGHFLETEN